MEILNIINHIYEYELKSYDEILDILKQTECRQVKHEMKMLKSGIDKMDYEQCLELDNVLGFKFRRKVK